jgi:hypothetical protein
MCDNANEIVECYMNGIGCEVNHERAIELLLHVRHSPHSHLTEDDMNKIALSLVQLGHRDHHDNDNNDVEEDIEVYDE